jgi:hypothetical protein
MASRYFKFLIILVIVLIVVTLSLVSYRYFFTRDKAQSDINIVISKCTNNNTNNVNNTNNTNAVTRCIALSLITGGYNKEAEKFCKALNGNAEKRCVASILFLQNRIDESLKICNDMTLMPRILCIVTFSPFTPDEAKDFCFANPSVDLYPSVDLCLSQVAYIQGNITSASESCKKIQTLTIKETCLDMTRRKITFFNLTSNSFQSILSANI